MSDRWRPSWPLWVLTVAILWAHPETGAAQDGCTFYVRAGVVSGDGTSPETAFATISEAAAAILNGGDIVCVGPGTYAEGNISPANTGVDVNFPVVFRAVPPLLPGDPSGPAELVPSPDSTITTGFLIRGLSHVVIDGFAISGFADAGIQVRRSNTQQSSHVTVLRNTIVDNGIGIDVAADGNIIIEQNTVTKNASTGISIVSCDPNEPNGSSRCAAATDPETARAFPFVSNNRVGANGGHGIFVQATRDGTFQNNVIYSNAGDGISLRASRDILIVNNLVYHNGEAGLAVGTGLAFGDAGLPSHGTNIINNTFYGNGNWGVEIGSANAGSLETLLVNNIIEDNAGGTKGVGLLGNSTCGYVAGFNLIADLSGPATPSNDYDVHASAQFVDPAGDDNILGAGFLGAELVDGSADDNFRLRLESPALNGGATAVSSLGLTGSTQETNEPDVGRVDIGFHYGASSDQDIVVEEPFMPIYVRMSGSDFNTGLLPEHSLASLEVAAPKAVAGVTVIVGPGTYDACHVGPPPDAGKAHFLADGQGRFTGDFPGTVLLNADLCEAGFLLPRSCFTSVDGFHVRGGGDAGIFVGPGANFAEIRNNVTFENRRGIQVQNAHEARIINNLAVYNIGGIQIGGVCSGTTAPNCPEAGSRAALVMNNTCYGNSGGNGILIGAGQGISSHAQVLYNITAANGQNGLQLGSNDSAFLHLEGFVAGFNVNTDGYGNVARPASDLVLGAEEALFVDPEGFNVAGDWALDRSFRLSNEAAGEAVTSRAVDRGSISAVEAGFGGLSTRSDGLGDDGPLDPGYHYPIRAGAGLLIGDCNEDMQVSVSELVYGLGMALGRASTDGCPAFDPNGDHEVTVSELVAAVSAALGS